jgi:hypothetical protein
MSRITFIKIGADGQPVAADSTEQHVAVLLPEHGIMFTATNVAKDVPQAECEAACKACAVAGFNDWELPTIDQLQLLIDRTRYEPAIDTDYFRDIANDWYWSTTPTAWSASGAWGVVFNDGGVLNSRRGYYGFALAVRRFGQ